MPNRYTLISFKTCPFVQRSVIVMNEKARKFDVTYIDSASRPDWFSAISPHGKVPVLKVGEDHVLFESAAIAEYLDEVEPPRLHPEDPIERALNRAWIDYTPTFGGGFAQTAYAMTEEAFEEKKAGLPAIFQRLEEALEGRPDDGPFFNGDAFSLVDAAFAPFLQRFTFLDRVRPLGVFETHPRIAAWRDALLARETVRTSTVPDIETVWRDSLVSGKRWLAQFLDDAPAAAR